MLLLAREDGDLLPLGAEAEGGRDLLPGVRRLPRVQRPSVPGGRGLRAGGRQRPVAIGEQGASGGGCVKTKKGSMNASVSQNTCPRYPGPVSPLAPIEAASGSGSPAEIRWYRAKRSARWLSGSPSTSTSASLHRSLQAATCRSHSSPGPRPTARSSEATGSRRSGPRSTATMRSTDPSSSRVQTANEPTPPSRPRTARKARSTPRPISTVLTGPGSLSPSERPTPGPAEASSTITSRSASEANRAETKRTSRPEGSRCLHVRNSVACRRSRIRTCSIVPGSSRPSRCPSTAGDRAVHSGPVTSSGPVRSSSARPNTPATYVAGADSPVPSSSDPRVPVLPFATVNHASTSRSRKGSNPSTSTRHEGSSTGCGVRGVPLRAGAAVIAVRRPSDLVARACGSPSRSRSRTRPRPPRAR